jgi:pimeloyl-ACP methyl ester carboxylesterase
VNGTPLERDDDHVGHLPDPGPEHRAALDTPPDAGDDGPDDVLDGGPDDGLLTVWLWTSDGVPIAARHDPRDPAADAGPLAGPDDLAFVVVHGFTGHALRPAIRAAVGALRRHGGVVSLDLRGHGRSGGLSEVGKGEVHDLAAAVRWARDLGYRRVVPVGFSLGAAVALQYAAQAATADGAPGPGDGALGPAAVVAVSGPSRWYFRGTRPMRLLHHAVEQPAGRLVLRTWFRTRTDPDRWDPVPDPPDVAVTRITVPLLLVHGDVDHYFPLDHPRRLAEAAAGRADLWIEPGFGHAENDAPADLIDRIGAWAARAT